MTLCFIDFDFWDLLDIVLVAAIIYLLYNLLKGTVAIKIFVGILFIYLIWRLVTALQMEMLGELLGQFIGVGVIALLIVFQKELRQFLLFLGNQEILSEGRKSGLLGKLFGSEVGDESYIAEIVSACDDLSKTKTGALIVVAYNSDPSNFATSSHALDASLSAQLLLSIFQKESPLHDGAVIVKDGRIASTCGILPVTEAQVEAGLGTRHRAALGISELTDSRTVIVSEQTGEISLAAEGKLRKNLTLNQLRQSLLTSQNPD